MILGIGTDLANIERIEATIARFGQRFLTRVFTEREQAKAQSRPYATAATYAKRWAAKEACSKALGTGLRMGISWKDMAVSNLWTGQPVMHLTGWAADRLAQMTPPGHRAIVHVTLTDDHPWAQAFIVIEALPLDEAPLDAPYPGELTRSEPPSP
jgi:holo-[acyl-carrier protein] synthase